MCTIFVTLPGIDIDPQRIAESNANAERAGVSHLVRFIQQDAMEVDVSEATVVTLYLLPSLNVRLMPQLEKLKPGSRIVSHDFDMRGAKPVQTVEMKVEEDEYLGDLGTYDHTIFKWVVPWERE